METTRLILLASLGLVLLLIWQAWEQENAPLRPKAETPIERKRAVEEEDDIPTAAVAEQGAPLPATGQPVETMLESDRRIHVRTDVLDVEIDTRGGDIRKVDLPRYPVAVNEPNTPFVLMNDEPPAIFLVQGGLLSRNAAPTHHAAYHVSETDYRLEEGSDEVRVPMTWVSDEGLAVTKAYTFHRGSYLIDVSYEVENHTQRAWQGRVYGQLQRNNGDSTIQQRFIYTYTGAAISSPDKRYEKINFDDMKEQELSRDIKDGWLAILQHYFVAALIPDPGAEYHYYTRVLKHGRYVAGLYGPDENVASGGRGAFQLRLYVGPKIQKTLASIAPGLDLTVDYGWLWFIGQPLFWLLQKLYAVTGNWGWAIVLVTIVVKALFYPLSAASYRSMANMRRVQPKMMAIRERFGNDRGRMNQAMMELYKEEKINPLGGCLPIVVQIPVFIALYWVLLESVELRQADFVLWIHDLSTRDPYFVLPLLMGISMFMQQKLNPVPIDPVQAKVMQLMPIIFTFFFAFFPSGLVLYWVVNNILSIGQQWLITRRLLEVGQTA
ncbi:MAG: membrane protein insertase YidC [Gammaproteobacteria bacterium]|nr:membrane protein insertase YidC [Gammaproteobacteria bacterium]MCI0590240.1 membrane protein insertase YidC [Gammaproteobacteria bacterium]